MVDEDCPKGRIAVPDQAGGFRVLQRLAADGAQVRDRGDRGPGHDRSEEGEAEPGDGGAAGSGVGVAQPQHAGADQAAKPAGQGGRVDRQGQPGQPEGGSDRPGGGQVGDDRQQRCPGGPRGPAEHPRAQRADKGRVQDEYGGDGHREVPSPRALRAWASACSSSAASCGLIWSTKWASAVRRSALVSSASLISDAVYPEREPVGS